MFTLAALENCMEDPALWEDVRFKAAHPVGNAGVWGGYDPARSRDDASFVVLLPSATAGGRIRVLERHKWTGKSYLWQVERIKEICGRYRFVHMGVDVTGPGQGVFENVRTFCPVVSPINYGVTSKAALVQKAQEVIEQNRLAFDASEVDIAHAFMTIRHSSTDAGAMTYTARRGNTTGHADVAWAIMHGLAAEPLARQYGATGRSSVTIG